MSGIEDYAIIGDLHTAALVGQDGSLDWLCLPHFDSPACFAALLDTPDAGRWRLAPASGGTCTSRRYQGDTLLLESDWVNPEGHVRVLDFMPPRGGPRIGHREQLHPGRRRGVPQHHRAKRLLFRPAAGSLVHRRPVERTTPAGAGLRLRAGHTGAGTASVPAHRAEPNRTDRTDRHDQGASTAHGDHDPIIVGRGTQRMTSAAPTGSGSSPVPGT